MKILMITAKPPLKTYGGAEKFCGDLAFGLYDRGIDVGILTSKIEKEALVRNRKLGGGVEIYPRLELARNIFLRKSLLDYFNLSNLGVLADVLKIARPDIVHFHNMYGAGTNLMSMSSRMLPTIATIHDCWPFCIRSTMLKSGRICDLRCWNCVFPLGGLTKLVKIKQLKDVFLVSPSTFLFTMLLKGGYSNSKIRVIHNGVKISTSSSQGKFRKRLLYIGRITRDKGVHLLCEASKRTDIPLDIIGHGPYLNELMRSYSKIKSISFAGYIDDVEKVLLHGGVLVLPSISPENFPTILLEAMAYGLPCIASRIGGIPEIIGDGITGKLFEPGSVEELINCINYVLEPDNYARLSRNSLDTVKKKFSWDETIDRYLDLYNCILNNYAEKR